MFSVCPEVTCGTWSCWRAYGAQSCRVQGPHSVSLCGLTPARCWLLLTTPSQSMTHELARWAGDDILYLSQSCLLLYFSNISLRTVMCLEMCPNWNFLHLGVKVGLLIIMFCRWSVRPRWQLRGSSRRMAVVWWSDCRTWLNLSRHVWPQLAAMSFSSTSAPARLAAQRCWNVRLGRVSFKWRLG